MQEKEPVIYLGMPTYPGGLVHYGAVHGLIDALRTNNVMMQFIASSYTTMSFNTLWGEALDLRDSTHGVTHFCMAHVDIVPEPGWLPKMLALMKKHDADILSTVVPVKTGAGVTSTGIEMGDDSIKRYTMWEVSGFPEKTFTHPRIVLNNGLMLIDIRKPWVDAVHFDHYNAIVKTSEGKRQSRGMPEDWLFSKTAREAGAQCFATAEIAVEHVGEFRYPNTHGWGSVQHDAGCPAILTKP